MTVPVGKPPNHAGRDGLTAKAVSSPRPKVGSGADPAPGARCEITMSRGP